MNSTYIKVSKYLAVGLIHKTVAINTPRDETINSVVHVLLPTLGTNESIQSKGK